MQSEDLMCNYTVIGQIPRHQITQLHSDVFIYLFFLVSHVTHNVINHGWHSWRTECILDVVCWHIEHLDFRSNRFSVRHEINNISLFILVKNDIWKTLHIWFSFNSTWPIGQKYDIVSEDVRIKNGRYILLQACHRTMFSNTWVTSQYTILSKLEWYTACRQVQPDSSGLFYANMTICTSPRIENILVFEMIFHAQ